LGAAYANGEGVTQDHVLAHMWLNLSRAQGHELARKNIEILAKQMTKQDIARAEKMASE
jgi:TPR repeat protein